MAKDTRDRLSPRSVPSRDPWHDTEIDQQQSPIFLFPRSGSITSRVSLFFFCFLLTNQSLSLWNTPQRHRTSKRRKTWQLSWILAQQQSRRRNTSKAVKISRSYFAQREGFSFPVEQATFFRWDKSLEENGPSAENFSAFLRTRGSGIARVIERNSDSKIMRYKKRTRIFCCFSENISKQPENIDSFEYASGNRLADAIELNSDSKLKRYKKQTRILPFFRANLRQNPSTLEWASNSRIADATGLNLNSKITRYQSKQDLFFRGNLYTWMKQDKVLKTLSTREN